MTSTRNSSFIHVNYSSKYLFTPFVTIDIFFPLVIQRIISSDSRSKLTSFKKVIRTSRGHTYVRIDDIPRSGSEIGEKDKEGSGSTKRRSRTGDISESQGQGGRSKKDKVRFDTKADAVDEEEGEVKGKGEKEGSGGDKNIKRLDKGDKKRRSSKDSGNKKGKGRRGSKKTGASSGVRDAREDRVQNGSSKDGKEVKQKNVSDKEEEESTKGTFMTQNEGTFESIGVHWKVTLPVFQHDVKGR